MTAKEMVEKLNEIIARHGGDMPLCEDIHGMRVVDVRMREKENGRNNPNFFVELITDTV